MTNNLDFEAETTHEELDSIEAADELTACGKLRDQLDAIYAKAFARAPKPVEFARLMAQAKVLHDQLTSADDKMSSFTSDISDKTRLHIKKVQRLVARGLKVRPEVLDLVENSPKLNKGYILDRLAQTPPAEQEATFEQLKADRPDRSTVSDEERATAFLRQYVKLPRATKDIVQAKLLELIKKGGA